MKIESKLRRFQMGGAAPAPEQAPAGPEQGMPAGAEGAPEQGGADPMTQILQVAAQAVQTQNCEAAMTVCQALIELVSQAQGGAPDQAPQGEPTFARNGARLVRVK